MWYFLHLRFRKIIDSYPPICDTFNRSVNCFKYVLLSVFVIELKLLRGVKLQFEKLFLLGLFQKCLVISVPQNFFLMLSVP